MTSSILRDTSAGDCWSGRIHPQLECPTVEPTVLTWNESASIVFAAGVLNQASLLRLASLVLAEARRPGVRLVYVLLALQGARLGSLRSTVATLAEAREHAGIVAFLDGVAYGPALCIAHHCDLIFASPTTSIGWLECFTAAGELECDATMAMLTDLAMMNPRVPATTWARLVQSAVTGEQAEALGMVGGLRRDVFELSGIDGSKWGGR